eukprot:15062082-Alexandrium_andersonii.AAC.1
MHGEESATKFLLGRRGALALAAAADALADADCLAVVPAGPVRRVPRRPPTPTPPSPEIGLVFALPDGPLAAAPLQRGQLAAPALPRDQLREL